MVTNNSVITNKILRYFINTSNAGGQTVTMPFVKDDGMWKSAMDKFIKVMVAKPTGKH
jgi:hypothetical protein